MSERETKNQREIERDRIKRLRAKKSVYTRYLRSEKSTKEITQKKGAFSNANIQSKKKFKIFIVSLPFSLY